MTRAPYEIEADDRPRLGLIVLQADETIEDEFRYLLDPAKVRLHISRVPSGAELTLRTIKAMETALPAAAALLPQGAIFDAVGYACTSGTSLIGASKVQQLVRSGCSCKRVTNPLEAAFSALKSRNASRLGIVSPYTDDIAQNMRLDFTKAGFDVARTRSFGEDSEAKVASISPRSIVDAVLSLTEGDDLDAVFLSCTNLRTLEAIDTLKREIDVPVLSSNLSLAWHMTNSVQVELVRYAASEF